MSEDAETPHIEAPAIDIVENVTRIALKTFVPSAAHGRKELDEFRAWRFAHTIGAGIEIAGLAMTVTQQELGPATWVAGKLVAHGAEMMAVKKAELRAKSAQKKVDAGVMRSEDAPPMPLKGIKGEESLLVKLPTKMVWAAGKVLAPSFLSAGKIEQSKYRRLLNVARGFEAATLPAIYIGEPGLAAGTYVAGRTIAVFAEAADRVMPRVKEKLKVLKKKDWVFKVGGKLKTGVGSASGAVTRGVRIVGAAGGGVIREVTAGAGLRVREGARVFGEKAEPVARETSDAAGRKLRESAIATKEELGKAVGAAKEKWQERGNRENKNANLTRGRRRIKKKRQQGK